MDTRFLKALQFLGICVCVASLVYAGIYFGVGDVLASTHTATTTAYAFGGTGAAGVQMQQYHVANHPPNTYCGGSIDPSGVWAWGTRITMDTNVWQRNYNQ